MRSCAIVTVWSLLLGKGGVAGCSESRSVVCFAAGWWFLLFFLVWCCPCSIWLSLSVATTQSKKKKSMIITTDS